MTTGEATAPRPTAKQLAEEALEIGQQLRTELTELRTQVKDGGLAGDPVAMSPKLAELDDDLGKLVTFVNEQVAELRSLVNAGGDAGTHGLADQVAALDKKVTESFKQFAAIVDRNNEGATTAIREIREQMPSVHDIGLRVADLAEKVRLFDEAGVAPASGEDVRSLDGRLKSLEQLLANPTEQPTVDHALAQISQEVTEGLNDVHQRVNELRAEFSHAVHVAGTLPKSGRSAMATPAIYGQVHELMNAVTELGKDKTADKKMGGYAFRSIDSAMDAVGRALRQVGVMFQPRAIIEKRIERYETVSKDGFRQNWTHVWVTQEYAFVSLRDGSEMAAIVMDGEARDNGDKSTSKADSMRLKYALLQALMIPVNGLPESDGSDGTEGGQVYGRGSAGDAFDAATPARPAQQDQTPPVDEATAYGYGHQPAESPSGQAHAQAQQGRPQDPVEDNRTPEEKAQAAHDALVALAGLEQPARRPQLNRILRGIQAEGLGDHWVNRVDGRPILLTDYAAIVNAQVGV